MTDFAIRAHNLSKVYKLYASPSHRLYDVLGFKRLAAKGMREFRALNEVSFEVPYGEKLAIIGRNGAGKSTLLKLVTKVVVPTAGELTVKGETRALLSLGTGFHPEFTGRQNAEGYLSSLGFSGAQLTQMVEDAIAFAEIEDYADQPVKTYSSGMAVRLMFSTATMMTPDLLVIDEVLGAGDAYFQHKSFERIRELCGAKKTTLLLVTHDVYSAAKLCDRMIWIDRGRILIDADPQAVLAAYNDSIRAQEERRLRIKALGSRRTTSANGGTRRILVELHAMNNRPLAAPIYVARMDLRIDGVTIAEAHLGENAAEGEGRVEMQASAWGDPVQHEGRLARPFRNWGSNFHKVAVMFDVPLRDDQLEAVQVEVVAWTEQPSPVHAVVHADQFERDLGSLRLEAHRWTDVTLGARAKAESPTPDPAATSTPVPVEVAPAELAMAAQDGPVVYEWSTASDPIEPAFPQAPAVAESMPTPPIHAPGVSAAAAAVSNVSAEVNTTGIYGTGEVVFDRLQCFDAAGRERHVLDAGQPACFRLSYKVNAPDFVDMVQLVLAFKKDGVIDVWRLFARDVVLSTGEDGRGRIDCAVSPLPLGIGRYTIVILVARSNYYDQSQTQFFSMNPDVYYANVSIHEIYVEGISQLYESTGSVLETQWLKS